MEYCFKGSKFELPYQKFRPYIEKYRKEIYYLAHNLTKCYGDREDSIKVLIDFVLDNSKNGKRILDDIREIVNNNTLAKLITDTVALDSPIANKIFKEILLNKPLMNFAINFFENTTNVETLKDLLINLPNKAYINIYVPNFVKSFYGEDQNTLSFLLNISSTILKNVITEESIKEFVTGELIDVIREKLYDDKISKANLSHNCQKLINYSFFSGKSDEIINFRYFYLKNFCWTQQKIKMIF